MARRILPASDVWPMRRSPIFSIRTGGEQRISNFLLWQLAYSEFHFHRDWGRNFDDAALDAAITSYRRRERRSGAPASRCAAFVELARVPPAPKLCAASHGQRCLRPGRHPRCWRVAGLALDSVCAAAPGALSTLPPSPALAGWDGAADEAGRPARVNVCICAAVFCWQQPWPRGTCSRVLGASVAFWILVVPAVVPLQWTLARNDSWLPARRPGDVCPTWRDGAPCNA